MITSFKYSLEPSYLLHILIRKLEDMHREPDKTDKNASKFSHGSTVLFMFEIPPGSKRQMLYLDYMLITLCNLQASLKVYTLIFKTFTHSWLSLTRLPKCMCLARKGYRLCRQHSTPLNIA